MADTTEVTKDEQKEAERIAAQRQWEARVLAFHRMSYAELRAELANAEMAGNAKAIKAIKQTITENEARDRARIIRASERAIEACERSGTPAQLAEEKARLESYKNGGPLPYP